MPKVSELTTTEQMIVEKADLWTVIEITKEGRKRNEFTNMKEATDFYLNLGGRKLLYAYHNQWGGVPLTIEELKLHNYL